MSHGTVRARTKLHACPSLHPHGHTPIPLVEVGTCQRRPPRHGTGTHFKSWHFKEPRGNVMPGLRHLSGLRKLGRLSTVLHRQRLTSDRAAIIYNSYNDGALIFQWDYADGYDYECAADDASWSWSCWGAHLHTLSSPEPSPVKSGPPSASSMVLTSFLEKRVPTSSNLEDDNQAKADPSSKEDRRSLHLMKQINFWWTYDGRSSWRMQLLLWREQKRTGVFPTRCMPKSVHNPWNRIGKVRSVVRSSSETSHSHKRAGKGKP